MRRLMPVLAVLALVFVLAAGFALVVGIVVARLRRGGRDAELSA